MSNNLKFYINGEWVEPISKETAQVINPATEAPVREIAMGNALDVDRAVEAAVAAFP
ncbi:MAG: aldehyde dehydrogenase family protein, partial [Pseudomonadota bacterium]